MGPTMALTKYNVLETFPVGGYQTAISEHLASAHIHTYIYILKHKHKQHFDMQQRPTAVFINALGHTHAWTSKPALSSTQQQQWSSLYPHFHFPDFPRFTPTYHDFLRFPSISLDFPPLCSLCPNVTPVSIWQTGTVRSPGLRPMPRQFWPFTST